MAQHTWILAPNPGGKIRFDISDLAFPWRGAAAHHLTNEMQQTVRLVYDYRRVMAGKEDWRECL